ncbi:hypothetical protein ES708_18602 [subsurface metagenome]
MASYRCRMSADLVFAEFPAIVAVAGAFPGAFAVSPEVILGIGITKLW